MYIFFFGSFNKSNKDKNKYGKIYPTNQQLMWHLIKS